MNQRPTALAALLAGTAAALLALPLPAADWPQWRGPNLNGSSPDTGLPSTWSKTEGVAWVAPLPGPSGATPIVTGDRVFVASPDPEKNLVLLCFDRGDGQRLWHKVVGVGDRSVGRNNMAAPSPVTDGKAVYALFGTSDLAAFDLAGNELWKRNLGQDFGKFSIMWLYGSSPLLHDGKLYVQVLQRDPPDDYAHALDSKPHRESYLLALDPKTGKDLWRHVRQTDSTKESQESYATPVPYTGRNGPELIVVGGDYVSGHSPASGEEVWRARLYDKRDDWYRIVTSPVAADGLIYASGPKGQPVVAFKDGGRGNVTDSHVAWRFEDAPTDWATPLLYQGRLFVLDGSKRVLTCLDPKTGAQKWQGKLDVDTLWSSPTGADGRVYVISEKGTAVVLGAGDKFEELAKIEMGEGPVKSSIAVAHGHLFVRTAQNLYCIGAR